MNEDTQDNNIGQCPNCQSPVHDSEIYCANCGQKIPRGMPNLWDLLGDLLDSLINLDSKFFKTVRDIFVPAKLTKKFFQGIRAQYYPPFRLLLFSSFLFFGMLGMTDFDEGLKEGMNISFDKYTKKISAINQLDSIKSKVLKKLPPDYEKVANMTFDTIRYTIHPAISDSMGITSFFSDKKWNFDKKDVALLTQKEIIKKYKVENFWDKLIVKQGLKTMKHPDKFVLFLIGNIVWLLVLLVPLMALVMKLLYIRRKKYYIEHFVFLLHQHSFLFIFTSLGLIIGYFTNSYTILGFCFALIPLYLLISLWLYYRQSIFKTFVKFFLFMFAYFFGALILMIAVMVVSLAVF